MPHHPDLRGTRVQIFTAAWARDHDLGGDNATKDVG
ncbi:Hypothetical protein NGAL_HAMBI1146_28480 [Neorhizobium galegae bv. officinalis]|nr:Hypothetical protein NGAL_HAMBI490_35170 [Neorhizobium galegae bv. officinalis]CDZ38363.1 Hypothetical protein NGAL_HAMBI1146_28480 [Neorhizobium galegae bv. officinalis]